MVSPLDAIAGSGTVWLDSSRLRDAPIRLYRLRGRRGLGLPHGTSLQYSSFTVDLRIDARLSNWLGY